MLERSDYVEGFALLAVSLLAAAVAGALCARRTHGGAGALPIVVAGAVYGSAVLVAAHQLPLMLGILSRGIVPVAACVLTAVAVAAVPRRGAPPDPQPARSPAWAWAIGATAAALTAIALIGFAIARTNELVTAVDALLYHLPQSARWIETGSLWQRDVWTPDISGWAYPGTGNLLQLAFVLPFGSPIFATAIALPAMALLALSITGAAGALGAPRAAAVAAAAAVVAIPAVADPAIETAQVDGPMLAWFAAGGYLLIRHARHGGWPDLVAGGIALGLAFGTKWYAVIYVPLLAAAHLAARLGAGSPPRAAIGDGVRLAVLVAAAGGVWLLRNWVEAGNPFHPAPVSVLGIEIFDAPPDPIREAGGFSIAHYASDWPAWRDYLVPAMRKTLGLALPLLAAGTLVAAVLAALRPRARAILVCVALAAAIALAYALTPYTALGPEGRPLLAQANTRYLVPGLVVAAILTAWVAARSTRWHAVVLVGLALAAADGLRRTVDAGVGAWLLGAVVAVALVAAVVAARSRPPGRLVATAAAVALVAGAAVAGEAWRKRAGDTWYGASDPGIAAALATASEHAAIGMAGQTAIEPFPPVLGLHGPRLQHRVEYVGRFERGTLRRYSTPAAFAAAVQRGRFEVLWVGLGRVGAPPGSQIPELAGARALGYREIERTPRAAILAAPAASR